MVTICETTSYYLMLLPSAWYDQQVCQSSAIDEASRHTNDYRFETDSKLKSYKLNFTNFQLWIKHKNIY